jgi:hypothetical protein
VGAVVYLRGAKKFGAKDKRLTVILEEIGLIVRSLSIQVVEIEPRRTVVDERIG